MKEPEKFVDYCFVEYIIYIMAESEDSVKPEKRDEDSSTDTEDVNTSPVQVSSLQSELKSKINLLQ